MAEMAKDMAGWRTERSRYRADILLSPEAIAASGIPDGNLAAFALRSTLLDPGLPVPAEIVRATHAVIVEVKCEHASSMDRLQQLLASAPDLPVLAAVSDPTINDVRRLMQTGVADVLPLPLRTAELLPALERLGADFERRTAHSGPAGRIVAAIKSRGGVGATTVLTQIAALHAGRQGGDESCLIDFDIQCGNAALYLGQLPALNLKDLLDAGNRLDSALLRAVLARHGSGLHYLGAPHEILPLDAVSAEQASAILDLASREFGTLFVDLPHDWSEWSLSTLAQADEILLVCDLSVASLHQAKRQIEFLRQQEIGRDAVRIVMNKVAKGLFKTIDFKDAQRILGREVAFSVAEDAQTVAAALDRGETVAAADPRGRTARDLQRIADGIAVQRAAAR
jgi:pilus assembly protein CpaE